MYDPHIGGQFCVRSYDCGGVRSVLFLWFRVGLLSFVQGLCDCGVMLVIFLWFRVGFRQSMAMLVLRLLHGGTHCCQGTLCLEISGSTLSSLTSLGVMP